MKHFPPPYASASQFEDRLRELGAAVIAPEGLCHWAEIPAEDLQALAPFWDDLPPDTHLRDGGRYRFRRHGSFVVADGELRQQGHRAHWQPLDYNALHGGLERWFEPVQPALAALPAWQTLLLRLARAADALKGPQPWFIETHQFRIDTTDGIGRPTPEGAHRDGVDLVAVFLVSRVGIKGGESRVFEADGPRGERFTLQEPWTLLLLDDERVIHETTPIQPAAEHGHRDTLVVTLRRGSFQDPV
ncbi:2OG-Fe dioxygenase family protein [Pelomonas sp. APW6]|uniref:2OG-Fe dioxygenase family protein n=1 Tax=Roseateles subflavus TaxID=3053353 RepID=A0ABT7LJT5_9BURK|nr:2OG-Fe dioxygenase family protein [Pelomonas sp. APW6]MDL5033122.1 2OG-Fe dioxygenase family protein [Pelomonas sp. APW6]